jgi:hypothetical protein
LGLFMRSLFGMGTPRSLQGRLAAVCALVIALWTRVDGLWCDLGMPPIDHDFTFTPNHRFEWFPVGAPEGAL